MALYSPKQLGKNLKMLSMVYSFDAQMVYEIIGISRSSYFAILRGQRQPKLNEFWSFCVLYNITPNDLLFKDSEKLRWLDYQKAEAIDS